jgi:hypothetical protein
MEVRMTGDPHRTAALLFALLALGGLACDNDTAGPTDDADGADADADVAPDAADADADADGADAPPDGEPEADVPPPPLCTAHNGVTADVEIAGSGAALIEYRAYMGSAAPYDVLRVQIMGDNVAAAAPGVYDLAGTTYDTCTVCVSVLADCRIGPCGRFFYPTAGTIEITAVGGPGERFAGRLRNVEMAEFEILPAGIDTEPLPDGDDWCIADHEFDRVASNSHDAVCERPTVPCLDETLLDFSLESCATGEMVAMSTLAAGNKALVYTMITGWCPYCPAWMDTLVGYQTTYAAQGLRVAYVYGESAASGQPTAEECLDYGARHGADPNSMFLDHDGTNSFVTTTWAMWPWTVASDTMGLPWSTIIDAQTYQYVFTNQGTPPVDFETVMLGLLGP